RYEGVLQFHGSNLDAQRKLYAVRAQRGVDDATWCSAHVLSFLLELDGTDVHERYRPRRLAALPKSLDPLAWTLLRSRQDDSVVADYFSAMPPGAIKMRGGFDVIDGCFRPAALGEPMFRSAFAFAARALGLPIERHFLDTSTEPVVALEAGADLQAKH